MLFLSSIFVPVKVAFPSSVKEICPFSSLANSYVATLPLPSSATRFPSSSNDTLYTWPSGSCCCSCFSSSISLLISSACWSNSAACCSNSSSSVCCSWVNPSLSSSSCASSFAISAHVFAAVSCWSLNWLACAFNSSACACAAAAAACAAIYSGLGTSSVDFTVPSSLYVVCVVVGLRELAKLASAAAVFSAVVAVESAVSAAVVTVWSSLCASATAVVIWSNCSDIFVSISSVSACAFPILEYTSSLLCSISCTSLYFPSIIDALSVSFAFVAAVWFWLVVFATLLRIKLSIDQSILVPSRGN